MDSCRAGVAYFDVVQELYTFFTASTSRYELLKGKLDEKIFLDNPLLDVVSYPHDT